MKTIVMWNECSEKVGYGHLMRCMTLGEALAFRGHYIKFLTNVPFETMYRYISKFQIDMIIIDNYDIPSKENLDKLRAKAKVVIFSDNPDLGGYVNADHIVNFSPAEDGLKYFILRREFGEQKEKVINGEVKNILVSFGSDPKHYIEEMLMFFNKEKLPYHIDLVFSPNMERIVDMRGMDFDYTVHCSPSISELLEKADLCICSGGNFLVEAMFMGVPCIAFAESDRECDHIVKYYEHFEHKLIMDGYFQCPKSWTAFKWSIFDIANDKKERERVSYMAQQYVDGHGIKRILDIIDPTPIETINAPIDIEEIATQIQEGFLEIGKELKNLIKILFGGWFS